MRNTMLAAVILVGATTMLGCRSSKGDDADRTTKKTADASFAPVAIPSTSPFAQLKYGMGEGEVTDLVGRPTDKDARITGKNFNPFYYGTDTHRETWFYKGVGRLTFNSRGRLIEAYHNVDERGYR